MKPERLYTLNTLTQENFNAIIDQLRGLENREVSIDDNDHFFGIGDELENSQIHFTKNARNEIDSFTIKIYEVSNRLPFVSVDGLLYENLDIENVLTGSDFQVVRKEDGTLIDGINYAINENGQLLFTSVYDELEVLVNGLHYVLHKTYFIGREETTRKINKISMTPQTDTESLVVQRLHPQTLLNNNDAIEILDKDGNQIGNTSSDYGRLFLNQFVPGHNFNSLHSENFKVDFKEPVIMESVEFFISNGVGYRFSMDIWVSKDKSSWVRAKRLRNIDDTGIINGKFRYDLDVVGAFRYIHFETIQNTHYITGTSDVNIFGYHPENKEMSGENKLGPVNLISEGLYTGAAYNNEVRMTTNALISNNTTQTEFEDPSKLYRAGQTDLQVETDEWVQYEFTEPTEINRIRFRTFGRPEWKLEASVDGITFIELVTHLKDENNVNNTEMGVIDKPVKVKFYKFTVINKVGTDSIAIQNPLILE